MITHELIDKGRIFAFYYGDMIFPSMLKLYKFKDRSIQKLIGYQAKVTKQRCKFHLK